MSQCVKIILAGVPEQVNIPIHICMERGIFAKYGVDVEFKVVPEGTGRMLDLIESSEVDIALTVADATIAGCAKGRSIQLCGTWVQSPLVWAIAGAENESFDELCNRKTISNEPLSFGVSRIGSGSHTMAQYACMLHNQDAKKAKFEVANDFKGLRTGVQEGRFDAFMWEVFTTKPWFDKKELSYLGEVPTPWPAFVFTTRPTAGSGDASGPGVLTGPGVTTETPSLSAEKAMAIHDRLFPALYEGMQVFIAECAVSKQEGEVSPGIQRIMQEFGHTAADAAMWMSRCQYSTDASMSINQTQLIKSVEILKQVGIVPEQYKPEELWTASNGIVNSIVNLN